MSHSIGNASPMRVGFLGAGAIAVPALAALVQSPLADLRFVGTQPDRPAGRRRRLTPTPVGQWCDDRGIACERVVTTRDEGFLERLRGLALDFLIVFAFGQILKRPLLQLPRLGCINVHASLLPAHRGASPIQAAILAGDAATGVTIMQMDVGLDTGPTYQKFPLPLTGSETAGELEGQLAELAGAKIVPALKDIVEQGLQPTPQDEAAASYAPRINKRDGRLDWLLPAAEIERRVRAYQPWPGTWFELRNGRRRQRLGVVATAVRPEVAEATPGTIVQADKQGWQIAASCGTIEILRCKPEGKREMSGVEFLRGASIRKGMILQQDETLTN